MPENTEGIEAGQKVLSTAGNVATGVAHAVFRDRFAKAVKGGATTRDALATALRQPTKKAKPRFSKDAAKRFRVAVRDAVRENMPLPKVIELGVISGVGKSASMPESKGEEYKPSKTSDAFKHGLQHALSKGMSTKDAIAAALRK